MAVNATLDRVRTTVDYSSEEEDEADMIQTATIELKQLMREKQRNEF